jgi:hypothetical protein
VRHEQRTRSDPPLNDSWPHVAHFNRDCVRDLRAGRLMATEEDLLNRLFDDASSDTERTATVRALKKITGMDRSALVEKYTSSSTSGTSGSSLDALLKDAENQQLREQMAGIGQMLQRARSELRSDRLMVYAALCEWEGLSKAQCQAMKNAESIDAAIMVIDAAVLEANGLRAELKKAKDAYDRDYLEPRRRKRAAYNAARRVKHEKKACEQCGRMFKPKRSVAKTCSSKCRQALHQARLVSNGYSERSASGAASDHNNQQNQRDAKPDKRMSGSERGEARP